MSTPYVNCSDNFQDLCIMDCSSKYALLRTFYRSNFKAKITDKLLAAMRIYLRKVDTESGTFFTLIWVWNLENNTKVFDEEVCDLENFAVGNFNNPYLHSNLYQHPRSFGLQGSSSSSKIRIESRRCLWWII